MSTFIVVGLVVSPAFILVVGLLSVSRRLRDLRTAYPRLPGPDAD